MPNFEQYAKKMQKVEGFIPKVFEKVAKKAGIFFVNEAKKKTTDEKLVDTGNYRRNWFADIGNPGKKFWVVRCLNNVEYASHLEYGHALRNAVPVVKKRYYTIKRPDNMERGRYKGFFVGKFSLEKAREFAAKELKKELGDLYKEE